MNAVKGEGLNAEGLNGEWRNAAGLGGLVWKLVYYAIIDAAFRRTGRATVAAP